MPSDIVDLSHFIDNDMPVYPGDLVPSIKNMASIENEGYQENELTLSTHTGTHIDAPAHIIPGGYTLDAFPPGKFFGEGLVLDCRKMKKITTDTIILSLSSHAPDFVLFYTGWDIYWGTDVYYGKIPVLDLDAAKYLSDLSLKGVGIDAPSFDPVGSESLGNHKTLLNNNIVLIENLTGLGYLLEKKFIFSCFPLKIKSADGSPVRATAIIED
jgi:kynurenine formamidase